MAAGGLIEQADTAIASFFQAWNSWTLVLSGVLVVILLWPIFVGKDPDVHPYLLARQAQAAPVRQPGESAIYRANEIPIGYPLRRGLAVKDPGAPKWSMGRDGDLRDVWIQAVRGPAEDNGAASPGKGKLFTLHGSDKALEHSLADVSKTINVIGKFVQEKNGRVVAVCLSNSVELLATIFASAFYGFRPVIMPYGVSQDKLDVLLSQTDADLLIAEAGSIELKAALSAASKIQHVIWVAKEGSKHLDWNEVPEGIGGLVDVSTWHDLVDEHKATAASEVPTPEKDSKHGPVAVFAESDQDYKLIEYTSANLVAGTAGLLSTMTRTQKLGHTDILLPTISLSNSYALCWTFAALFSGASVALNSVAGNTIDVTKAIVGVKPTIVVASSQSIKSLAERATATSSGLAAWSRRRSLQSGVFPSGKPSSLIIPHMADMRLLFLSHQEGSPVTQYAHGLSNIRLALGTRTGYALTAGSVAGAVTQSNIFDYRDRGAVANVGVPMTSTEVLLTGKDEDLDSLTPTGKIMVRGPAVVGGKVQLNVTGRIEADHTIALI